MSLTEEFKDKSDEDILKEMEVLSADCLSGRQILQSILTVRAAQASSRAAEASSKQNETMIKLTRAIGVLTWALFGVGILQIAIMIFKK